MADVPRAPLYTRRWVPQRVQDEFYPNIVLGLPPPVATAPIVPSLFAQPAVARASAGQTALAQNLILTATGLYRPSDNPLQNPVRRAYQQPDYAYVNLVIGLAAPPAVPEIRPTFFLVNPVRRPYQQVPQVFANVTLNLPPPAPPTLYTAQRRYVKPRAWLWGLNG